ncbi:MAG: type II secretion system F family protein [Planctomycetota bacterium]
MFRVIGSTISVLAWSLVGGVILVLLTGVIIFTLGPLLGVLSPLLSIFTVLILARLVVRARQRRAMTIIGHLEQATRLNLPLPQMLLAAQRGERGAAGRRLGDIRRAVEAGMPVGEALDNYAPEVAWRDRREIAVNERIGRLGPALTRVHQRTLKRLRSEGGENEAAIGWSYGISITAFVLFLLGGITVLIMPKFIEIFEDFETVLPWPTQVTFNLGRSLNWWLFGFAVVAILLIAGHALRSISRPAEGEWTRVPGAEMVLRLIPGVGRMLGDRSWAAAYATAGDALAAGYQLPESLRLAADTTASRRIHGKLTHMAEAIDYGGNLAAAASLAKLPPLARGLLGALDQGGDAKETLGFLSRYHDSRFSRLSSFLRASVMPAVVFVLAVVVGWIVYSLTLPIVILIFSVMPSWEVL